MSCTSRGVRAAARSIRQSTRVQTRRYASHGEGHGHEAQGATQSAYDVDGGVSKAGEGFGRGFYIAIAAVPFFYISYQLATNEKNVVSRFVDGFSTVKDKFESKTNSVHDAMMQQALEDRFTLKTTPRGEAGPPVRYIEHLNAGSPINRVAGEGTTDLNALIEHQREQTRRKEEARSARLRQ